jgi:sugar-specific transcriptional regulator TrmB
VTKVSHHHHQDTVGLGEETIEKVLKNLGLTEKEAEIYIFLAKHGVLKGGEIARLIKKDKAQVFRILKSLQSKGLVESTLEAPTRFTAIPFETVLDSFIKSKRDEAASVETAKKELLSHFEKFTKTEHEPAPEKFVTIEGNRKIYSKILQMIKDTKNELSAVSTVSGLVRADQFGLLDAAFTHPSKSKIQFRFLTEVSSQNLNAMKALLERMPKTGVNFRGRNPDLGLELSPRMVIRDEEEIIYFITPAKDTATRQQDDVCLWTNCKALVQSFKAVFKDLWRNSTDIQEKIAQNKADVLEPQSYTAGETAEKKYNEAISSAKKEILISTSSQGLIELSKNLPFMKNLTNRGLSLRIMAPIAGENFKAMQQLSEFSEIRHVPERRGQTILIDGAHLFHLLESMFFYTIDSDYVDKIKDRMDYAWKNACPPSALTLESIMNPPELAAEQRPPESRYTQYLKMSIQVEEQTMGTITEKDILNKMINAKRIKARDPLKDVNSLIGSNGHCIIHPPEHFNLPDIMMSVWHCGKQSSWGTEDWLSVFLWLETPMGWRYVPVAHVTDNPRVLEFRKGVWAGTPAAQNIHLVKKEQLQVHVHGNTLFAGWTVPIPLFPPPYVLPPSCIQFEGHGSIKTGISKTRAPSGRIQVQEFNRFDAFVTYFHPSSKYSGPGTDGIFNREIIMTAYPPP